MSIDQPLPTKYFLSDIEGAVSNSDIASVSINDNTQSQGIYMLSAQEGMKQILTTLNALQQGQGVIIKTQTWRGDETGLQIAKACGDAANRGVKIHILKDTKGDTFERGEGKPFWKTRYSVSSKIKATLFQSFYDNQIDTEPTSLDLEISKCEQLLRNHENIEVETRARYDHSKLVLIYDEETRQPQKIFNGGASFGNEWNGIGDNQYIDQIMMVDNPELLELFTSALQGDNKGWENGVCILTHENYHDVIQETLMNFTGKVRSSIAYLGESTRINAFEQKDGVEMLMSRKSNINRWRNWQFILELCRREEKGFLNGLKGQIGSPKLFEYLLDFLKMNPQSIPENMDVILLQKILHMKAIVCGDDFAAAGSGNMVERGYAELGIAFQRGHSQIANDSINRVHTLLNTVIAENREPGRVDAVKMNLYSQNLQNEGTIETSLWRAQFIEHFAMTVEEFMANIFFAKNIRDIRQNEQELFKTKLSKNPI